MKKYSQYFSWLMGVVGTVLGIIGIIQLFEEQSLWFKIILVAAIFISIAIAAVFITIISQSKDKNIANGFIGDKSVMIQENKKYLTGMFKNHEYNDVCNIGSVFSRVFYIAAAYKSRYSIATMVFISADYLKRDKLCASTLLDLGWMALLLGKDNFKSFEHNGVQYDSPDDFFKQSIEYSMRINDYALISKAHRHLHGFYLTVGDFAVAQQHREECGKYIDMLPDGSDKKKIVADLFYIDAETAFFQKKYSIALEKCVAADKLKKGVDDETREIRYYAQKGKIELKMNNIDSAMQEFSKGLEASKRLKRIDEITKNTYGYAMCLLMKGQRHEAESLVKTTFKKYGNIPLFITDELLRSDYKNMLVKHSFSLGGEEDA